MTPRTIHTEQDYTIHFFFSIMVGTKWNNFHVKAHQSCHHTHRILYTLPVYRT